MPIGRGLRCDSIATSRAIGTPALAMVISSPNTTRWRSRDK
jgi:hypothetical protein